MTRDCSVRSEPPSTTNTVFGDHRFYKMHELALASPTCVF